jgi:type I restriction enzyme, S subunit
VSEGRKGLWTLPASWRWAEFAEVARVDSNLVDPAAYEEHPHIAPNHIESNTGQLLEYTTIKEDGVTSGKHLFRPGHILYSKIRPYLAKAVVVDFAGLCSADMYPVSTELETRYLHRWLVSPMFTEQAAQNQGRTVLPKINQDALGRLPVPVPPPKEQRRIVAKLESVSSRSRRARAALDAVPPLLEKLRQSILAAAFRGDLTKDWRAKNKKVEPAEKLLARIRVERRKKWEEAELAKMTAKGKVPNDDGWKAKYKEPEPVDTAGLPGLPEGWCWASFDDLAYDSLYGPRFGADQYAAEGFPTLRTTDLDDEGRVVWNAPPHVRISGSEYVAVGLRPHDFVVTRTGATIGKCALFREGDDRALPSAYLIRFGLVSQTVDSEYTLQAMLSPAIQAGLRGGATATAQPNVNARTIAALAIPVAPKPEQAHILAALATAGGQVAAARLAHDASASSLSTLDRALLAKAFRGELVPQDPNDEPAQTTLAQPKPEGRKAKARP